MTPESPLSAGDNPDYIASILAYLDEREPLAVFEETPDALRAATVNLPEVQLTTPEAPGKWTVLNVVQHLGQTEIALGFRYRKVLAEEGSGLPAIDQDAWVTALFPEAVSLEEALDDFAVMRRLNLRLLGRVTGTQWQRYGMHSQRGKETLRDMIRLYAAHDCYHLHQIQRIRQRVQGTD